MPSEIGYLHFQSMLGPDDIRRVRGDLSRAEFARRLGVTPLTVYRWELPDGAAEARRPRGAIAQRLAAIAGAGNAPAPAPRGLATAERGELVLILDRLAEGELRRVEHELVAVLGSGRLETDAARALAGQALARTALLARGASRDALAALVPILAGVDALPGEVALEVHVTAALTFSSADGRIFDAGRCNAHIARGERLLDRFGTPEARCLLTIARRAMTFVTGEAPLDDAGTPLELPATSGAVLRSLAAEAAGVREFFAGSGRRGWDHFEKAAAGPVPISRVRALAHLVYLAAEEMRPPAAVLARVEEAHALTREHRIVPGLHSMILASVEGELLSRLGRFAEAEQAYLRGLEILDEIAWSPAALTAPMGRLYLATRPAGLEELGRRFLAHGGVIGRGATRALGELLLAAARLAAGDDPDAELARIDAQLEQFEAEGGWTFMLRDLTALVAAIAVSRAPVATARRVLRRAERYLERFPSIGGTAWCRRLDGLLLAREGRLDEARQALEVALGTFTLGGDAPQAALARDALAALDAAPAAAVSRMPARPARAAADVDRLVVPLERLSVRGMSARLLQRELVAIAAEWLPGATVRLDELGPDGEATLLERGGPTGASSESVEFAGGGGRRLRLSVGGAAAGPELRSRLVVLTGIASLALEIAALRGLAERPAAPAADLADVPELPDLVAVSPAMRRLKADLARLSHSRATVIITGESGTGKEVVARAIHDLSTRAGEPYVAFNCAAVPHELFEGQLFGYRKGAFTGATSDQPGVIRAADGGTLFLDEIGELPLDVQPKLLRFLEQGEILPLGERAPLRVDIRVVAATNRDLEQLVRERRFREDLYYRLQVVPVRVPPLRERPDDVVALARHFVRRLTPAGREPPVLAPDALAALAAHAWPGNVRELRNVIERSLAFAPLPMVLGAEHLRIAG